MRPSKSVSVAVVGAALTAGVLATPAFSQEAAGFRFNWEINFTTLLSMFVVGIGWYLTVSKQGETIKSHAATITNLKTQLATKVEADALAKMQDTVETLGITIQAIRVQHDQLKDEVYKEYLSVRSFDKIKNELRDDAHQTENRLMEAINGLSGRIDNLASMRPAK